jgi:UDP-N-acetylmuramate dehydrogenase
MTKDQNPKIGANLQKKLGGKVLVGEPLKKYTTMRVGGPARFLYKALDSSQLVQSVKAAIGLGIPYFILGKGGNVIFSDKGFEGLVIINRAENLFFFPEEAQVLAESGIANSQLVVKTVPKGLGGIEFLASIPGTLGGSIYGNAGAYGWEICSFIKSLNLLEVDIKSRQIQLVRRPGKALQPLYRSTLLKRRQAEFSKRSKGISQGSCQPLILSAVLQLQRKSEDQIRRQIQRYIELRKRRQPQGIISSGSIFKNPLGRSSKEEEVYKDVKQTAAHMLDQVGAKKVRVGDVRVSSKHANFFTHSGKATAQDIKDLVDLLRDRVYQEFGIELEPEIEFVGEFN